MEKLFEKEDVLTNITAEQAALGTPGYFGDTLSDLYTAIELRAVMTLSSVDQAKAYCFKTNNDQDQYTLFLPLGRVKKSHTYTYRPLANLEELLEFLVPDVDVNAVCDNAGNDDEIIRYEKAKLLLGKQITIRQKFGYYSYVVIIQSVDFYGKADNSKDIYINNMSPDYLFECYEILIDGEWQPFGVRDYNEN